MFLKKLSALTLGVAAMGLTAIPAVAQDFKGVTVDILTRPGYVIAGPLAERGKDFEAMTGAKIVVTEVPLLRFFQRFKLTGQLAPIRSTWAFSQPVGV